MNATADLLFTGPLAALTADRRRAQRVLGSWMRTAQGRFPSWADMRRIDLGDDWNWTFVVDLEKSIGVPHFVFLGPHLAKLSELYLHGPEVWTMSVLDRAAAQIDKAARTRAPQIGEDDLTLLDGREISFRSLTIPLADDGDRVTHILGAVSGRMISGLRRPLN